MKILATMVVAAPATAWVGETGAEQERKVTVCIGSNADGPQIRSAQGLASKLFARIGVRIDWRELRSCTAGGSALQVSLSFDTPPNQLPG
jgi:hypothetical protein